MQRQAEERFHDHIFTLGLKEGRERGWRKAIECLRIMELVDAAERLEAMDKPGC